MSNLPVPDLCIRNLCYVLPNGHRLLNDLNGRFGSEHAALVGRNGAGKTTLAKIMAGLLAPPSGSVAFDGIVFYLDQMTDPSKFSTVADLAGSQNILDAIRRIENGNPLERDLETADGHWDMEERMNRELHAAGLPYLTPRDSASRLSGGECTRVALVGAFVSGADFLILDEPTNHLDAESKRNLLDYLATWKKGFLAISHDRELLDRTERIVEISSSGLKSYGGNYSFYAEAKAQERRAALARLEHAKTERKRAASGLRETFERQEHRIAQGRKSKMSQGLPKIVLNAMRGSGEKTAGKLHEMSAEKTTALAAVEKEAFLNAEMEDPVVLIPPLCFVHASKTVLRLDGVALPYGTHGTPIDFALAGPERVAIEGQNGSGKTTLLRILTGVMAPLSGICEVKVPWAYLDQFASLDAKRPSVELLRESSGGELSLGDAGTRLAQIGLARERLQLPTGALSGGERLKVALLCALHRIPAPQLLILDEPTNHLDLDSVESVEKVLKAYTGALIVVSHDKYFLERIGIERRLALGEPESGMKD